MANFAIFIIPANFVMEKGPKNFSKWPKSEIFLMRGERQ
jgi:hypothetical protein